MRATVWLAAAVAVVMLAPLLGATTVPYETKWFQQDLDHFSFATTAKWSQRYLVSTQFWNGTGPVVFYTGNEGDIAWFWNNTGFAPVIAEHVGALLVFGEHRYYGESLPFGKASYERENLRYFTSEQALADYAVLLRDIAQTYYHGARPRVVAIGGSYGGMLAAWFRAKYPSVVDAALAASAPVLQFEGTGFDPLAFNRIATEDFARTNSVCPHAVRMVVKQLMGVTSAEASRALYRSFGTCKEEDTTEALYNWIYNGLTYMAMTDYPYPTSFLQPMPGSPVAVACNSMVDALEKHPEAYVYAVRQALNVYYNYSGQQSQCYNLTQDSSGSLGDAGWNFQACTEMVMPVSANMVSDMFMPATFDMAAYARACVSSQGVTPRPLWVPTHYFGAGPLRELSRVVFSNGQLDPWRGGGVVSNATLGDAVAYVIEGGAHHLDLRAPDPQDPPSVRWVRQRELEWIAQWLSD